MPFEHFYAEYVVIVAYSVMQSGGDSFIVSDSFVKIYLDQEKILTKYLKANMFLLLYYDDFDYS